jgi:hypothetical protein
MDTSQYHRKMIPHTSGNPFNLVLPTDPTKAYKASLIKTLLPLADRIPFPLYKQLHPTREVTPRMQGQPKVHKPPDDRGQYPFRPIVFGRDSITAPISKHLAHILTPITIKNPYQVQDSLHLKHTLSQFTIPDTHILTSFDITNMYPSIPRIPAIAALRCLLERDHTLKQRTSMFIDDIITLQEAVLRPVVGDLLCPDGRLRHGRLHQHPGLQHVHDRVHGNVLTRYRHIHDPPPHPTSTASCERHPLLVPRG